MPAFGLNYSTVQCSRLDNKAMTDNGNDVVALVVTTGTQGYGKAEEKLCLLWTDCWLVCGLNDRPGFILMPRLDD